MRIFFTTTVWLLTVSGIIPLETVNNINTANPGTGILPPQPEQLAAPPQVLKNSNPKEGGSSHGSGSPTQEPEIPIPSPGTVAGIVCGVLAVIVMVVIILILCRKKLFCKRASGGASEQKINTSQNTEKNDPDHHCDEIRMQDNQVPAVSTLYSTVNPPAEQLHYASINIQSGESTGKDKNSSSASNNSFEGAANPPAETTLYSTVGKLGE